ncbi:hemicentin-1-like [Ylistrum balloti]|uniref:hemicentin-1-like n=1 Tax=Ylistrum balloti TaxID=509963 RepID=UPI002905F47D|nr:hemicentin-1-like [Ylistrum balloti]
MLDILQPAGHWKSDSCRQEKLGSGLGSGGRRPGRGCWIPCWRVGDVVAIGDDKLNPNTLSDNGVDVDEYALRVPKTTYSVLAGLTITLECSISPPIYLSNVHWTKEGRQAQVFSSVSPRNTKYSGSSYRRPSLTIRDTNVKDTGTYTCRGLKSKGETYSRSPLNLTGSPITLTVYNPFAVTIKPSKENISKQIGDFLPERTCVSDDCRGKCEVVWTLPNGRKKKDKIFNKNISKDDTGKYICTISNEVQSESISFYVTVNYGPQSVTLTLSGHQSLRKGQHFSARCQADCSPSCAFYWTGGNINQAYRRANILSIERLSKTDSGVYHCSASNDYGNKSTSLKINVEYGPDDISLEPTTRRYNILEGIVINDINCSADCNPACHFSWTRNNLPVSNDTTLSLGSSNSSKDGTYTCTARGVNTKSTTSITVKTLYGPKSMTLSRNGDLSVLEGTNVNIRCRADCSPSCDIIWTGPNFNRDGRRGTNLNITKATRTDHGVYTCTASNEYSEISTSLKINVIYGGSDIRLAPTETHYTKKEGSKIPDIRCTAGCNPACEISWYHDRTGRVWQGDRLSLLNMLRSRDGNYTCAANNSQGTQTTNVTVLSLFPPEVPRKDLLNSTYIVRMGDAWTSSMSVEASPSPLAYLQHERDGNGPAVERNLSMQSTRYDYYSTKYTYSIENITNSDLGYYTLTVTNSQGRFLYEFSINTLDAGTSLAQGAIHPAVWISVVIVLILIIVTVIVILKRKHNKERKRNVSQRSAETFHGVHNASYEQQDIAPQGLQGLPQQPADAFISIHGTESEQSRPVNDVYANVVRPKSRDEAISTGPNNVDGMVNEPSRKSADAIGAEPNSLYAMVQKPARNSGEYDD